VVAVVVEERELLLQLELVEERVPGGKEGRWRGVPAGGLAHEVLPDCGGSYRLLRRAIAGDAIALGEHGQQLVR
jgi:hypothetical protein